MPSGSVRSKSSYTRKRRVGRPKRKRTTKKKSPGIYQRLADIEYELNKRKRSGSVTSSSTSSTRRRGRPRKRRVVRSKSKSRSRSRSRTSRSRSRSLSRSRVTKTSRRSSVELKPISKIIKTKRGSKYIY